MRGARARAVLGNPLAVVLIVGVLTSLALQGALLPHTHDAWTPGLYNHEHDFTTLAAFGGGAPLPAAAPVVAIAVALAQVIAPVAWRPVGACHRHADFRAPPAR